MNRIHLSTSVYLILAILTFCLSCSPVTIDRIRQTAYDEGFAAGQKEALAAIDQAREQSYKQGYQRGALEAVRECDLCLKRVPYEVVLDFLAEDKTDQSSGNCLDKAVAINNNAIARGIWCYVVVFNYSTGIYSKSHAIVAFDTTDRGIVYFEPETDQQVELRLGMDYSQEICKGGKICPIEKMIVTQIGIIK